VVSAVNTYAVCAGFTNILAQVNLYAALDWNNSTLMTGFHSDEQNPIVETLNRTTYTWKGLDGAGIADSTTCLYLPPITASQAAANVTLLVLVEWDNLMLPINSSISFYVNPETVGDATLQSSGWAINGKLKAYQKAWFAAIPQTAAPPAQLRVEQCDFLPTIMDDSGATNRFRVGLTIFPPSWGPLTCTRQNLKLFAN